MQRERTGVKWNGEDHDTNTNKCSPPKQVVQRYESKSDLSGGLTIGFTSLASECLATHLQRPRDGNEPISAKVLQTSCIDRHQVDNVA